MTQEGSMPRRAELEIPLTEFDESSARTATEVLGGDWTSMPREATLGIGGFRDVRYWDLEKRPRITTVVRIRVETKGGAWRGIGSVQLLFPSPRGGWADIASIPSVDRVRFNFEEGSVLFLGNNGESYLITDGGKRHEFSAPGRDSQVFEPPITS